VHGDRRQIQTAVLGGADSEEPLMLPLEAIELDAFRRRREHDTFLLDSAQLGTARILHSPRSGSRREGTRQ